MPINPNAEPYSGIDHEWRRNGIGSSDASVIMGTSPWMNIETLFGIKLGLIIPPPPTFIMLRGLKMEAEARIAYEQQTGILMPADRAKLEHIPFIRANFDGINHDVKRVLEIKCPGREDHATAMSGKIPDKYYWQLVHLLLVSGYEELDYYSYNPSMGGGVIVPFKRNIRAEKKLIEEETRFWEEHVLKNISPSFKEAETMTYTALELIEFLEMAASLGVESISLPALDVVLRGERQEAPKQGVVETKPKVNDSFFRVRKSRPGSKRSVPKAALALIQDFEENR